MVKGPAQNKFGPVHWYHLSLATKNIIKVDLMKNSISVLRMNSYEQRKDTSLTSGQNSLLSLLVEQ